MNEKRLKTFFGLKYNPFISNIPAEHLWLPPGTEEFFSCVEMMMNYGGFAMITGESGLGKSRILQALAVRLSENYDDAAVGIMQRPQSKITDFYRELGDIFGVNLKPANKYGGFTTLRERWKEHVKRTLVKPILLIDEAQEVPVNCLTELRLLSSDRFDSECLMTTVLCGDTRLPDRFRVPELLPLGSRIRNRLVLRPWDRKQILEFLDHSLRECGTPNLMTDALKLTLADHCAGNLRVLTGMAAQLLNRAGINRISELDEKLYIDTFKNVGVK